LAQGDLGTKRNDGTSGFCNTRKIRAGEWQSILAGLGAVFNLPLVAIYLAIFGNIWQYILACARNGNFWQYAALQFYLHPMHTNQMVAGTIKSCFDTIAKSCTAYKPLKIAHICKELAHLQRVVPIAAFDYQTSHCNVTGYKCNGN